VRGHDDDQLFASDSRNPGKSSGLPPRRFEPRCETSSYRIGYPSALGLPTFRRLPRRQPPHGAGKKRVVVIARDDVHMKVEDVLACLASTVLAEVHADRSELVARDLGQTTKSLLIAI
jgi:hypothetical protein